MQVGRQGISLKYDYGQILRPKKMSMSRDYHYRRIGGLGGLDRVTNNNFAKRTLIFIKINPLSNKRTATLVVAAPTARRIRGLRCAACSRGRGMARRPSARLRKGLVCPPAAEGGARRADRGTRSGLLTWPHHASYGVCCSRRSATGPETRRPEGRPRFTGYGVCCSRRSAARPETRRPEGRPRFTGYGGHHSPGGPHAKRQERP
jgi:hypothetical protein